MKKDLSINEWAKYIDNYCERKGWNEGLTFEKAAMNFHSEISEAWEEYRKGKGFNEIYYEKTDKLPNKPEGIPIELADTIIRILHFAGHFNIDMEEMMSEKMQYNETREYRHGNKIA